MAFRGIENGRDNWKYLTYEDALRQPVEILDPDLATRLETLEHLQQFGGSLRESQS
jgi:hypothetical protein